MILLHPYLRLQKLSTRRMFRPKVAYLSAPLRPTTR